MTRWISIEDKCPQEGQDILCYATSKDGKFTLISQCRYSEHWFNLYGCDYSKFSTKIFCEGNVYALNEPNKILNPEQNDGHFYYGTITHWIPIPKFKSSCNMKNKKTQIKDK